MTMRMEVGRDEMMRAERPLEKPHMPSSAMSCLNVSITDERPSTLWDRKKNLLPNWIKGIDRIVGFVIGKKESKPDISLSKIKI